MRAGSLAGRIVEERLEDGLLLCGDSGWGVVAFAIFPMLPLLLASVQRGDVFPVQQRGWVKAAAKKVETEKIGLSYDLGDGRLNRLVASRS